MTHTIETMKELNEQRFAAIDKATAIAAIEIDRRLDVLNHSHEVMREKERTFINRETFEIFRQRISDDIMLLRNDTQTAAAATTHVREEALKAVAHDITARNAKNESRFASIEAVYARLVGGLAFGAVILPLITGMVIYIMTKSQ